MEEDVREISFAPGATVVVQNSENPGYFYIVREGVLEIDSEHRLNEKVLSRFTAGDSFGLVSALAGHRILVTIFASTPARVLRIPVRKLGVFLEENKGLAMKLVALYSRELRALQKHLSKANAPGERAQHPGKLIENAGTYLAWGNERLASYALHKFIAWAETSGETARVEEARAMLARLSDKYPGPVWNANLQQLAKGEVLFAENEISDDIFVVESGAVRLIQIVRGTEFVVDVLEAGEIFGEMSLIDQAPRMASAVVEMDSQIIRLPKENLLEKTGAKVLQKIFESLARRIWFSHQRLLILRIPDPVARTYAFLYTLIRNDLIRKGKDFDHTNSQAFEFKMDLADMQKMCGILKVSPEKLRPLMEDTNLDLREDSITVRNSKRLMDKVPFRTETGQIAPNLIA